MFLEFVHWVFAALAWDFSGGFKCILVKDSIQVRFYNGKTNQQTDQQNSAWCCHFCIILSLQWWNQCS